MHAHPAPLHPMVTISPFYKWGIYFMTCNPTLANGHGYIIMATNYFTNWVKDFPTLSNDSTTTALFVFNHIITRFGVPKTIVTDHGSHFCNNMMTKLASRLGFHHENSMPYYPQANGQVEATNHILKTMIHRMLGKQKTN